MTAATINLETARHQANINAKAANLITLGYKIAPFISTPDAFYVDTPNGDTYFVNVPEGKRSHCTCPGFEKSRICSHVIACEEEARLLALVGDMENDYRDETEGGYAAPVAVVTASALPHSCGVCGTPCEVTEEGETFFTPCFECEARL